MQCYRLFICPVLYQLSYQGLAFESQNPRFAKAWHRVWNQMIFDRLARNPQCKSGCEGDNAGNKHLLLFLQRNHNPDSLIYLVIALC